MHHRPECGGPPEDRPYYDALTEATANLVRVRELEADAETRRRRREALDNQVLGAAVARADRKEAVRQVAASTERRDAVRQIAASPRVLPTPLDAPTARPAVEPPRVIPALEPGVIPGVHTAQPRQAVPVRPYRRTPRSPR